MSIVNEKMFASLRPDLAPPTDASGGVIISPLLDSKEAVFGEHIYVLVDQWEASPATVERKTLEDAKTKLLSWKTSHPSALTHPPTIDAINQLIVRIDAMLVTPPPVRPMEVGVTPEVLSKAKNQFEEFLLSKGFPEDSIDKYDPNTLKFKRSFALTIVLQPIRGNDWPNMLSPTPKSVTYSSERFPDKLDAVQLAEKASENLNPGIEKQAVEKELGKIGEGGLRTDILLIDEIFDIFKMMKESTGRGNAQQSPEEMMKVYSKLRTLNMLDKTRIAAWGAMPPLLKEDMRTPEALSLGELFFSTFQEILIQGREWEADPAVPNWKRSKKKGVTVKVPDPKKRNKRAYADSSGTPLQVLVESVSPPAIREQDRSLFPESDAGGAGDVKAKAIDRLRFVVTKAVESGTSATFSAYRGRGTKDCLDDFAGERAINPNRKFSLSAEVATILGYQFAVILGESDFQDSVKDRPVGKNIAARLYQAFLYAQKTNTEEATDSKTNLYICGRILTYLRTFLKFAAMSDGRTLEQAILAKNSWGEIAQLSSTWPDSMTQRWCDHILQGYGEYIRGESGLASGEIFKLAEINFGEGRVVINQKILKDLLDALRFSWEYYMVRDQYPSAVVENWPEREKKFTQQPGGARRLMVSDPIDPTAHPPSEEFSLITIAKSDGTIVYESNGNPCITRMPTTMLVSPMRLGSWILAPDTIKNTGGEGYKGKGYNPDNTQIVVHDVLDASGVRTGQQYKEIVVTLKQGVDAAKNTPALLSRRLLTEYVLSLISMPGDTMAKLDKKDIIPLGIFFSKEMRDRYLRGEYAGFSIQLKTEVANSVEHVFGESAKIIAEFLQREDPGIYGLDLFSQDQYFELLSRMGYKISAEDFQQMFSVGKALAFGGKAAEAAKHK